MNEEENQKEILKAIDLLPQELDQNQILSMILAIGDAHSEDDEELAVILCMTLALYMRVNAVDIEPVQSLLEKCYESLSVRSVRRERMN